MVYNSVNKKNNFGNDIIFYNVKMVFIFFYYYDFNRIVFFFNKIKWKKKIIEIICNEFMIIFK